MAHPAYYFIKFLILTQADPSLAGINAVLTTYGMGSVSAPDLKRITDEDLTPPAYLRPWDKTCRRSVTWLRERRIFSLFHPDETTREMDTRIFGNPRLRTDIESLILGNVDPREASWRLRKIKKPISDLAISEYRHYFWNPEVMGLTDWSDYLQKDDSKRTSSVKSSFRAALAGGEDLALYRVGVVKEVDPKEALKEIFREMYFTFREVQTLPADSRKVEMLSTLSRGMSRLDERLAAGDTALTEVLKKFSKFQVRTESQDVKSLFDLAPSGSVSRQSRQEISTTKEPN